MSYAAPLKDMLFVVNELANLSAVHALPGCEDATPETVEAVLEENAKFCGEVVAPLQGEMADDAGSAQVEVRASWTPTSEVGAHVAAWSELLCTLAGLPPLSPGVVPLQRRRGRR